MDILREIVDLDRSAADAVKKAADEERKKSAEGAAAAAKARDEKIAGERGRAVDLRKTQEKTLSERLMRAESDKQARCKAVTDIFDANRAAWKEEIFKRITEG